MKPHPWPVAALLCLALAACAGQRSSAENQTLTVFAAASLAQPFSTVGELYESQEPGMKVVFNFAASNHLRAQLEQGARADVFASANVEEMRAAVGAGLVAAGTERTFARNHLIVTFSEGHPATITTLTDLTRPGLKLAIADASTPIGRYTLAMLEAMSEDPAYGADFKDHVLANAVSFEQTVKGVLNKVLLGEVDAGIVYVSDLAGEASSKLGRLEIPESYNPLALYQVAPLVNASSPEPALRFIELLLSARGQETLTSYSLLPAAAEGP